MLSESGSNFQKEGLLKRKLDSTEPLAASKKVKSEKKAKTTPVKELV
jgi:hypothetical protein